MRACFSHADLPSEQRIFVEQSMAKGQGETFAPFYTFSFLVWWSRLKTTGLATLREGNFLLGELCSKSDFSL